MRMTHQQSRVMNISKVDFKKIIIYKFILKGRKVRLENKFINK